jgi:signal transduction histidine kinase
LREALAEALADPSVDVWFAAGPGVWVQDDGERRSLPPTPPGRRVEQVLDARGQPLCAIGVEPRAVHDEQLFQAALRATGLGLENDRLRAQLLLRMAEVEDSRERIVEAAASERRRVERDLHDGAQQQLLAVAASLARAGLVEDPTQVREAVSGARTQLVEALAELRRLARGIHPAALSQGGLEAALPGLAETAAIPTRVVLCEGMRGRRFKTAVESTTYYVVAEALTNVVRHAQATRAEVTIDLRDGDGSPAQPCLVVTVSDDGRGGVIVRPDGGLAGLRDRIQALGGTLGVDGGVDGRGTTIRAQVPVGPIAPRAGNGS